MSEGTHKSGDGFLWLRDAATIVLFTPPSSPWKEKKMSRIKNYKLTKRLPGVLTIGELKNTSVRWAGWGTNKWGMENG